MTFADTLGVSGRFRDPLWRVEFALSALEQELLRSWPVRRLGFIAHAGASAMVSTQSYSRLEHSLGLLALVVHFSPDDRYARAAALLHDVGHLPFSHTFEGVAGLDHHRLRIQRVTELAPLLRRHGLDSVLLVEIMGGTRSSVLHGDHDGLRLDHLDSFVRSGRAHGRTHEPPPSTLSQLRLSNGVVDTDTGTADYLIELIEAEARWQSSEPNVVATAVVRKLAERLIEDRVTGQSENRSAELAAMTDDESGRSCLRIPGPQRWPQRCVAIRLVGTCFPMARPRLVSRTTSASWCPGATWVGRSSTAGRCPRR